MNKIKVMVVNECSFLASGYGRYGHNLLTHLHKDPRFEMIEMGTFYTLGDERANSIPWKFCPNFPSVSLSKQEIEEFTKSQECQMGYALFDAIALQERPHVVLNITDYWSQKFINNSPYRKCFSSLWLAPHDSIPQNIEWLEDMQNHDGVLGYTDWAISEINKAAPKVKTFGSVPGAAAPEYTPMNKNDLKRSLGIGTDNQIVGTVMRNQFRKLFPNLFASFRKFLNKTGKNNVYLYCHTTYPDGSFNIPNLLQTHNIAHKTLFTYSCRKCKYAFPSFYCDIATCPQCHHLSAMMPTTHHGVDEKTLAKIYNIFDCYVQYSNSGGLEISQLEAAQCGVPVMSVDYSAMSDVVRKVSGYPIKVLGYNTEMSTGCLRALPDDNHLVELLINFFRKPQAIRNMEGKKTENALHQNYSWEKTAKVWADAIVAVAKGDRWNTPPNLHVAAPYQDLNCSNVEYANWLVRDVWGRPDKIGSVMHSTLIRDLNYGMMTGANNPNTSSEDSVLFNNNKLMHFDREIAYKVFKQLSDDNYHKELLRKEKLGL